MDDMKKEAEREARTMWEFICTFLKWLIIAGVTGGIGGLVGSAFHLSVNWAATFRAAHPWLLWLLPVGGLLIAAIYRLTKMENKNTNAIIDAIHFGDKVPLLLVPAIYLSTVITHLFWKENRTKIDTESCPSGRRCSTRNAVDRKVSRVRIPNSPPQKACKQARLQAF